MAPIPTGSSDINVALLKFTFQQLKRIMPCILYIFQCFGRVIKFSPVKVLNPPQT